MQKVIELELDQAAKTQENRLLMLKYKNFDSAKSGSQLKISAKRFDLASIDSSQLQRNSDAQYRSNDHLR